ncbi:hypothetical protein ES705_15217 [subsurface metagenome]
MTDYKISEEELNKLSYIEKASNHPKSDIRVWLKEIKSKKPIESLNRDEIEDELDMAYARGVVADNTDNMEYAEDLISKLNIPEIEEVIGEYQATVRKLSAVNAEKIKLQHQLDDIPQEYATPRKIRENNIKFGERLDKILSKYKDDYKVYGLMENESFQKDIRELSQLAKPEIDKLQESSGEVIGIIEGEVAGAGRIVGEYDIGEYLFNLQGQKVKLIIHKCKESK